MVTQYIVVWYLYRFLTALLLFNRYHYSSIEYYLSIQYSNQTQSRLTSSRVTRGEDRLPTKEVVRNSETLLRRTRANVRLSAGARVYVRGPSRTAVAYVRVQSRWYSALETRRERVPWIHAPYTPGAIVTTMVARVRSRDADHSLSIRLFSFLFTYDLCGTHCCTTSCRSHTKEKNIPARTYKDTPVPSETSRNLA